MIDHNIRALLEQAMNVLTSFEQNYGSLWYSTSEPEQIDSVCSALRAELAKPAQEDRLHKAAESLLANANWNVGGVLSAESPIRDFPSNGIAKVRLRDLARIRDALKTVPPTPAWHDAPEVAALKAERDELLSVLKKLSAWNKSYPSSRIYGYGDIKRIAAEMDAINAEADAAIAKAEGKEGGAA